MTPTTQKREAAEESERIAHDIWAGIRLSRHYQFTPDDYLVLEEALDLLTQIVKRNERRAA